MTRVLVVAAHPDDETIGASTMLATRHELTVIHVTDGAPRDRRWWPRGAPSSREEYARLRRREADAALALAGVDSARIHRLGLVDLEACRALPELITVLRDAIDRARPELLITHAYEGGHPDHDAVAFAVAEACAGLARPRVVEMAL
jgi:LmbE family N-acetylglucosaminyl deacetylase